MNIFTIYVLITMILALAALVVALNFYRYRFTGDKTVLFLTLFILFFALDIALTLTLLDYSAISQNQKAPLEDTLDYF